MAHGIAAAALLCLLVHTAVGQNTTACDPSTAVLELAALTTDIGYVACKAGPGANLTAAFGGLGGSLASITKDQVAQLPKLINVLLGAPAGSVEPFLSLTAAQLEALLPLLTKVPAPILAGTFQELAKAPNGTLDNMLLLLSKLPQSTLDSLLPLFERLTPQQLAVMRKAVTTLPPQSVAKLTQMVQASGPLANIVAAKAQFLPSIRIVDNKFANTPASPPDTKKIAAEFYGKRDSKCPNKTVCTEEDAGLRALDALGSLTGVSGNGSNAIGDAVCRLGADAIVPALNETLQILRGQCPDVLAGLGPLTAGLGRVDPKVVSLFFNIPVDTLRQLVPVLSTLPPSATAGLGSLARLTPADIQKMITFTTQVSYGQLVNQIKFVSGLSKQQMEGLAGLLAAQSPGQIALTIRLLDKFGFTLNPIGAALGIAVPTTTTSSNAANAASTNQVVIRPRLGFITFGKH